MENLEDLVAILLLKGVTTEEPCCIFHGPASQGSALKCTRVLTPTYLRLRI